jgi:hypothetical protein
MSARKYLARKYAVLMAMLAAVADAFGLNEIPGVVMAVGISVIIGVIVVLILLGLQSTGSIASNSIANGIINNGISGASNIFAQYPLLGTIIGLLLILAVVIFFFYRGRTGEGVGTL